jgi:hypothetical protein
MKHMSFTLLVCTLLIVACGGGVPPTPTPVQTPIADEAQGANSLLLDITAPEDEMVLSESSLVVRGQTIADAVVSVNGQLVEPDADGNFAVTIELAGGPNAIEIVASDFEGNEASRVISVIRTS